MAEWLTPNVIHVEDIWQSEISDTQISRKQDKYSTEVADLKFLDCDTCAQMVMYQVLPQ